MESRLHFLINKHSDGKASAFSRFVGIPSATFYRYLEQGFITKTVHILSICESCNVSTDWLLTGKNDSKINKPKESNKKYNITSLLEEWIDEDTRREILLELKIEHHIPEFKEWIDGNESEKEDVETNPRRKIA